MHAMTLHGVVHGVHLVGADLVPKSPRTAVDHHADLPGAQPECLGDRLVEHLSDMLDFQEVIPRTQTAQLLASPRPRTVAHRCGVGLLEPTAILTAVQVELAS